MAKARSRAIVRRKKDKWKSKEWYKVLAPAAFENISVADTLADNPEKLIDRVTVVSLQDITNDFRKSHIKLLLKINKVEENNAYTKFAGHTLTSDYVKRMIRRKSSKIDNVLDITTRDNAKIRVKPFAIVNKRIQNSQKKIIRQAMKQTIQRIAKNTTMSEFIKNIFNGELGKEIYIDCKKLYPIRRVEIYKTEVLSDPKPSEEEKDKKKEKEKKPAVKKEKTKKKKEKNKEKKETKEDEEKNKEDK